MFNYDSNTHAEILKSATEFATEVFKRGGFRRNIKQGSHSANISHSVELPWTPEVK